MRAADRAIKQKYDFNAHFINKNPEAEKYFKGRDFKLTVYREYDELLSACDEFVKLGDMPSMAPDINSELSKYVERVRDLTLKGAATADYKLPTLNPSIGFDAVSREWSKHADAYDALTNRMRPFIHNDLKFTRICNLVCTSKQGDEGIKARELLNETWSLKAAKKCFDMIFIKYAGFKSMIMMTHGSTENFRGDLLVHYPYYFVGSNVKEPSDLQEHLKNFIDSKRSRFDNESLHMCKVVNEEFVFDWLRKYEWHAGPDSNYFETYMDVQAVQDIVRMAIFPSLGDKVVALLCLRDMIIDQRLTENIFPSI